MPLRSSPDDMPAPTSSPRHSDRPRVPTLQQALGIGPSAPPPPRSRVSSPGFVAAESPLKDDVFDRPTTPPPSGFAGDEMEDDFGANDHTHDMAAEPTVASSWKPLGWQNPDPPAVHDVGAEKTKIRDWAPSEDVPLDAPAAPAIESLALAEARRELDSNSEEPRSKQDNSPEANSIAPPTAQKKSASVYVMKSEAVDDLGAPEPRPSRAPVTHVDHAKSRVKNVDPRREDRSSLPPEIVRGSESILPPMFNTNEAETRSDDATGNVIVDMGDAVTQLAKELMRQGPEDEGAILQALMRHGEAPLPVLAQAFPGPLWFSRHSVYRKLPRGRDVSAVARALYAYRERSVPYVASLLESNIPDRRFYAAMLAGDLSHQGLVTALMVRVFDDDDGVRALALELLPRCRGFPEVFAEGLALIRRALRVRSKDPFRRLLAVYACGVLRDVESVPDLIDALDEARELKDNEFLRTVQRALVEITAEDLGQHPKKWFDWWEKNKSRDRVEWLIDGLAHSEEWLRGLAFEELKSTTQQYFGYQPNAPRKEREVAAQKYRKWFEENAGARPA